MSLREWFRARRRATWPRFWGVSPIVADSPRVSGNLLPCVCVAPVDESFVLVLAHCALHGKQVRVILTELKEMS